MNRFHKNMGSWALTTKVYIILHRALKDHAIAVPMAKELKDKENTLLVYQRKKNDKATGRLPSAVFRLRHLLRAQTEPCTKNSASTT